MLILKGYSGVNDMPNQLQRGVRFACVEGMD